MGDSAEDINRKQTDAAGVHVNDEPATAGAVGPFEIPAAKLHDGMIQQAQNELENAEALGLGTRAAAARRQLSDLGVNERQAEQAKAVKDEPPHGRRTAERQTTKQDATTKQNNAGKRVNAKTKDNPDAKGGTGDSNEE